MSDRSEAAPPGRQPLAPILSLGVAALLVVSGGAVGVGMAMAGGGHGMTWGGSPVASSQRAAPQQVPAAPAPATFQLTGLPEATVAQYAFARDNVETYARIPCYCGCADMLGHRHLADCFVTPSGTWESHAAGCQVCLAESRMVARMMARGMGPGMMRDWIEAEFGGPPMGGMGMSS